jgi:hypothetical protein
MSVTKDTDQSLASVAARAAPVIPIARGRSRAPDIEPALQPFVEAMADLIIAKLLNRGVNT